MVEKTSYTIIAVILGFIVIMAWTRVWGCEPNKITGKCPSRLGWIIAACTITAGSVGILIYLYKNNELFGKEPVDPCENGLESEGCDVAEFCWNPPDVYQTSCKLYCDRRPNFIDPDCLLVNCENAIRQAGDALWTSPVYQDIIDRCYPICYRRVTENYQSVCSNMLCSQPVENIEPEYSTGVNAHCEDYCQTQPYSTSCYTRTCGSEEDSTDDRCICSRYTEDNKDSTEPLPRSEECDRYCMSVRTDEICDTYNCLVNPVFGCNEPCEGIQCIPTGEKRTLKNKCSSRSVQGESGVLRMVDDEHGTEYGYTHVSDNRYTIWSDFGFMRADRYGVISIAEDYADGDLFYIISNGKKYEYYIQTDKLYNSGDGIMAPRYLGETTVRTSGLCELGLGVVPTPNKNKLNQITWRFAPIYEN